MRYPIPEEPWDDVCKACDVYNRRFKPLRQEKPSYPLIKQEVACELTVCLVVLAGVVLGLWLACKAILWLF